MSCALHAWIQEFLLGGGGGGVQVRQPENSLDNVFVCFFFGLLQRGSNGFITEKLYFSKDPTFSRGGGGSNIYRGVQLFPGGWGVQMLISIETHITCDFPGGGGGSGPPIPPLGPHMH